MTHLLIIDTASLYASRYKGNTHTGQIAKLSPEQYETMEDYLHMIDYFRVVGWDEE